MSYDDFLKVMQVLAPAGAAFISVKIAIATALERADNAQKMADSAHRRIDKIMEIL